MMFGLTGAAHAQSVNLNYIGAQTTTTITAPSNGVVTFVSPAALATTQNGRQSCWIQYVGTGTQAVPTTPSSIGFLYFGPTAPTSTAQAFELVPYQIVYCEEGDEIEGSRVWVSSNATSGVFVFKVK
jgi:hypothetical protein